MNCVHYTGRYRAIIFGRWYGLCGKRRRDLVEFGSSLPCSIRFEVSDIPATGYGRRGCCVGDCRQGFCRQAGRNPSDGRRTAIAATAAIRKRAGRRVRSLCARLNRGPDPPAAAAPLVRKIFTLAAHLSKNHAQAGPRAHRPTGIPAEDTAHLQHGVTTGCSRG